MSISKDIKKLCPFLFNLAQSKAQAPGRIDLSQSTFDQLPSARCIAQRFPRGQHKAEFDKFLAKIKKETFQMAHTKKSEKYCQWPFIRVILTRPPFFRRPC